PRRPARLAPRARYRRETPVHDERRQWRRDGDRCRDKRAAGFDPGRPLPVGGDRRRVIPASPTPSALCVEGLTFSYSGKQVLEDVSFKIKPGEFTVLLGPSGAGKTTLFSLITRLYDSRVGKISINGAAVRAAPGAALSRLRVVFQQPTLDLGLTVRQNLLYHA